MLFFGILSLLLAVTSAEVCYKATEAACLPNGANKSSDIRLPECNAVYGSIKDVQVNLQSFAMANLETSFKFLFMSSYVGTYEYNREGFKKLYRKHSDKLWDDAVDVMKYITNRGGSMNFEQPSQLSANVSQGSLDLSELPSLSRALDILKELADAAFRIHKKAQEHNSHDPAIAHYIDEQFLESHTERVRELAGYVTELKKLSSAQDYAVATFLFDEYLQKSL
ncbi:ferritin 2 light chain [Nomia melanderi]|uniref:ferritin 2 light chain n=1 Tax=Nomia melanderi TaxID=2448451 RepID=UPI0013045F77|nr:ferritin heavy chain [Nomia melanderi]XP_031837136.1 ferritin heavy chain [Nomia melanderi]